MPPMSFFFWKFLIFLILVKQILFLLKEEIMIPFAIFLVAGCVFNND